MIAQTIARAAVLAGHKARFVNTADLLLDVASQDSARKLDSRLKHWVVSRPLRRAGSVTAERSWQTGGPLA